MPLGIQKVDVNKCAKPRFKHPCDKQKPCDPFFQLNQCPKPYICQERIKNPAWPGEITTCKTGAFMYSKRCDKLADKPPHPCDPKPPCSWKTVHERRRKLGCIGIPLCYERIKNPEDRRKEDPSCDESR